MRNSLTVRVHAPAERALFCTNAAKIAVYEVKKGENQTVFSVKHADVKRFFVAAERYGLQYDVLSDTRVRTLFKQNVFRFGLYLGAAIFIVLTFLYATYLTRMEIKGNDRTDRAVIEKIVYSHLSFPAKKGDVDVKAIQKEVAKSDNVANASVYIRGNILVVEVSEELQKVEIFDRSEYADVVSKYDAIVTRVIPYDGRAVVEKGQEVKCGETLLSGVVPLDEEKGLFYQTRPFGEIYGVVRFTKEVVFPDVTVEKYRTGNSATRVSFFTEKSFSPPFRYYETEKRSGFLYNLFPFPIYQTTFYELKEREKETDFFENFESVLAEEKNKFFSELPEGVERDFSYEIKRLDKSTLFSLYYDIEIKIS